MNRRHKLILLACVFICFLLAAVSGLADAGNFGGDSDWGGGSSDWGSSSSDWGSSSSSWGWSSSSGQSLSSSDGFGCVGDMLFPIIVIVAVVLILNRRKNKSGQNSDGQSVYKPSTEPAGQPLSILKEKDPNFNEQDLLEQVGNLYMQMQDAWQKKDWEPMRAFMTDSLFNQMGRQLNELKEQGLTNCVERIAVLDSFISRYYQEGDNDVLVIRLSTRICDYTIKDATGELVRGNKTRELFMTYDWKMTRQKDRETLEKDTMTKVNCPNCGAPLSIKHTGHCEYCGTTVTLSDHDWALSSIKGISQRSNG